MGQNGFQPARKGVQLTGERLRQLLEYDPGTGVFTRKMSTSPKAMAGESAGSYDAHRVAISVDGVRYQAHILAWLYVYGTMPPSHLAHKNGSRHDNRISNLVLIKSGEPLTASRLRELLHYDPSTGVFTRRVKAGSRALAGRQAGSRNLRQGHSFISVDGEKYQAHRLAWLYMTGEWPKQHIDHINGDGFDNRFSNLRDVSQQINAQNLRRGQRGSTSQYLGVSWDSKNEVWVAQIKIDGRNRQLGRFQIEEDAYAKYLATKRVIHAGCSI